MSCQNGESLQISLKPSYENNDLKATFNYVADCKTLLTCLLIDITVWIESSLLKSTLVELFSLGKSFKFMCDRPFPHYF